MSRIGQKFVGGPRRRPHPQVSVIGGGITSPTATPPTLDSFDRIGDSKLYLFPHSLEPYLACPRCATFLPVTESTCPSCGQAQA